MPKKRDKFARGYVCAVATLVSMRGSSVDAVELLKAGGFDSIKVMRDDGIDDFDIDTLRPIVRELQAQRKRMNKIYKRTWGKNGETGK